uniref:Uncharacterized protein n=1 Tax=Cacopsylla melanoneura TaxID=428564 RepID=A0A8D8ZQ40_9HEMI
MKPQIVKWSSSTENNRYLEIILTRLRIGHTRLTHSHYFTRSDPPICRCGAPLSIIHLLSCTSYANVRSRLACPPSLTDDQEGIDALFSFLRTTNLIDKI